ncbi:hypothetical protein PUN28_005052 [Cardiocondyla obscurior]|uniref:Odorant receptor n=1 Tax=Cardiocondyla obscurior TaxID=286306 RepID=A0AAW2GFQ4_9HYME
MFSNHEETNFPENRYYKLNQMLLSAVSLWPYRRSKFTNISHIFHFVIMTSFVFFQVKRIWKDIHDSWSLLKNETERKIMQQHSSSGELMTMLLALSVVTSIILYMFTELLSSILDFIVPINGTRPHELHALTEYFVDQTTYYYPILCHWILSLCFGCFVFLATGTLELVYVENICGLMKVASYRIECSLNKYALNNSEQKNYAAYRYTITAAIDIHRRALKCSQFFEDNFQAYFFVLVIIGVISTSLNLFRLLRAIMMQNMYQLIASTLFIIFHFLFLFLGNYYGQKITDCNNEVFYTVYNVQWYDAPVKIQKLFLFIMQNTTTPYILNIGNLIFASVEGFFKLVSMSMSYFTVIYTLM